MDPQDRHDSLNKEHMAKLDDFSVRASPTKDPEGEWKDILVMGVEGANRGKAPQDGDGKIVTERTASLIQSHPICTSNTPMPAINPPPRLLSCSCFPTTSIPAFPLLVPNVVLLHQPAQGEENIPIRRCSQAHPIHHSFGRPVRSGEHSVEAMVEGPCPSSCNFAFFCPS